MKKILFAIFIMVLTSQSFAGNLKIKIKAYKKIKDAEFSICIDKYNIRYGSGYYNKFDTIYSNKNGVFDIKDLNVGRYVVAIMHPSSEILLYNVFIPQPDATVELNVELDDVIISKEIDSVRVVGKANGWNIWKNHQMMTHDKNSGLWKLKVNNAENAYGEFYFVLNKNEKTHSTALPVANKKDESWADYHNYLNEGEDEIIFNPKNYKTGLHDYKVKIKGNPENFHALCDSLAKLKSDIFQAYSETRKNENIDAYKKTYKEIEMKYSIIKNDNKELSWMFPNYDYQFSQIHPINIQKSILYKNKKMDAFADLSKSKEASDLIQKQILILYKTENSDLALTPYLVGAMANSFYNIRNYMLNDVLNIPYGYFENFLSEVLKKSNSDEIKGEIIYNKARRIKRNLPEKAKEMYESIVKNYPQYPGVKNGRIETELKGLSVTKGSMAPDFKLTALDGKKISLDDFKGKYVFIDFWGTWCAPCKAEIPHIIKLRNEIPKEDLVILGVACRDQEDNVKKYIEENGLNYLNAMANINIEAEYGVSSYPSTFLLNPEGKIISKNLRGSSLTDQVQSHME